MKLRVLAEGDVGRNGVHVRGKHQVGRLAGHAGIDIPARTGGGALGRLRHRRLFHCPAAAGKKVGQKIAHCALVVGGGFDLAQSSTGKPDGIERAANDLS